jgi:hypothetical protein
MEHGAVPPGKTFEEHVGARYREAIEVATQATKGRWVLAAVPAKRDAAAAGSSAAGADPKGDGGEDDKEEQEEEQDTEPPSVPARKLVGNRFWRPLPHVIGTQEFYQDDSLGIDPARAIAPDAATAAAVGGLPLGGPYHWDDDDDGRGLSLAHNRPLFHLISVGFKPLY